METVANRDLQLAFDFVRYTNRNIFLTGKAGTGKTTFLRELRNLSPKRQIIVAPTGVAAINAGGVTIHSFFQLPFHPYIPTFYLPEYGRMKPAGREEGPGYRMSREKINIIKSLDLLIIDEISMVRADTLDAIDAALRRYRTRHLPFGGVQLLMIGDLRQLAPVVKDEDREILSPYYNSFFFFGSRALSCADYLTIELKHIYRQTDPSFISMLNRVRDNQVDIETLDELNKRYFSGFDPDSGGGYITLTTHNSQARTINDSKLARLPSSERKFDAEIKDEFPELSYPNDAELVLKKGAQVMFVKNDLSPEKLFFNGKIGTVVEFKGETIVVKCPDDDFSIDVERAEWQNMKYTLDEETKELEETVIGTFTQYPLRLAWAITIHKSQGLTFDRVVIDAKAAFAHGQVYVALSRCRTLDGIVLSSRIDNHCIIDNETVTGFISDSASRQPGPEQLAESRKAYQMQLLTELFDFSSLAGRLKHCIRIVNENSSALIGNPLEVAEKAAAGLKEQVTEVAEKFRLQMNALSGGAADPESNDQLLERVKKAAVFFSGKLESLFREILDGYSAETDNKVVRKAVNDAFERTRQDVVIRLACLDAVKSGFRTAAYLDARAKASINIPPVRKKRAKKETQAGGVAEHPALFNRLKEWRNQKVKETGLPHYMILHQKTIMALSDDLPRSMESLRQVKGIGKKKADDYGQELLEIISAYCDAANSSTTEDLPA